MSDDRRIVYEFVASGQQSVQAAYRGNAAAAVESAKAIGRSEAATRRAGSSVSQAAREQERTAKQAVRAQETAAKQAAAAHERALKHVAGIKERFLRDEQAKQERADKRAASEQEKALRHVAAVRERYFREEQRRQERQEAARRRLYERDSVSVSRFTKAGFGFVAGGLGALGLASIGQRAVGAVSDGFTTAAGQSLRLQEAANRISINARGAGDAFVDPTVLRREFEGTARATPGIQAADVADAVQRFVSLTGDLKTARAGQQTFATIASGSGSNIGDVAEAAASLYQQFDVKSIDDMRDALAALVFQGKNGAFELRDAAAQFQRLAASGAAFGIPRGVAGVKTLGGLTQIARTGTGSAEQATTAVENLLTQFKAKSSNLRAQGVSVFKNGKVRGIEDLIVETISKVGGGDIARKQSGLQTIFGEQGIRAINPLVSRYNETYQTTKGSEAEKTAAGMAVLRDMLNKAINAAGTYADVQKDAAQAQRDTSAVLTQAWEQIVAAVGVAAVPAIEDMAKRIPGAIGPIVDAFALLASAILGTVEWLQGWGVIDGPSAQDKLTQAQKEQDAYEATLSTGPQRPEVEAKRKALAAKVATAQAAVAAPFDVSKDIGNEEDFVKRFTAAQGTYGAASPYDRERDAKRMYQNILADPNETRGMVESYAGFSYSKDQAALVSQYAEQVTAGRTIGVGSAASEGAQPVNVDTNAANDALAKLADSADKANQQLSSIGLQQASVFP